MTAHVSGQYFYFFHSVIIHYCVCKFGWGELGVRRQKIKVWCRKWLDTVILAAGTVRIATPVKSHTGLDGGCSPGSMPPILLLLLSMGNNLTPELSCAQPVPSNSLYDMIVHSSQYVEFPFPSEYSVRTFIRLFTCPSFPSSPVIFAFSLPWNRYYASSKQKGSSAPPSSWVTREHKKASGNHYRTGRAWSYLLP